MLIAFFSEGQYTGKVPRNHPSMRVDLAWIASLNADHYPLYSEPSTEYDLGIFIIPKKCENGHFDLPIWKNDFFKNKIKPKLKRIAYLQEGANSLWQDLRIETQFSLLEFMNDADFIFCHNEIDEKYYKGLISHKSVSVLPSLMVEDSIPIEAKKVAQNVNLSERRGTIIGGNFCEWYGGMDSFMIAQEFGEKIYVPSMGRKIENEEMIEGLNHLPYMNWSQWMIELSKMKYAVHLMRTYAAGTFSLNCSRLSLPCISYESIDTQRICQPDLTIKEGDLTAARKLAKHLKTNQQFYDHCSAVAYKNYIDNFTEELFLKKFEENFK